MENIYKQQILIDKCEFKKNTGAMGFYEELYKMPYYHYLTSQKFMLNFYKVNSNKEC